ncbi:MAG: hypothetical protein AAGF86_16305 [Pseudomonadota bacterium]
MENALQGAVDEEAREGQSVGVEEENTHPAGHEGEAERGGQGHLLVMIDALRQAASPGVCV